MCGAVDFEEYLLQDVLGPRMIADQAIGYTVQAVEVEFEELTQRLGVPPSHGFQLASSRATHGRPPRQRAISYAALPRIFRSWWSGLFHFLYAPQSANVTHSRKCYQFFRTRLVTFWASPAYRRMTNEG